MKPAAADKRLHRHRGKALAFDDYNHMAREVERDDLDVTPDHMLVLKNGGPEGRSRHAGMGHAADPEEAGERGRARHAAHFRRAHERHQLRRLHPARGAGKLCRRPAGLREDRRRDRGRRRGAPHPSACRRGGNGAPPRRLDAARAALRARLWRDVLRSTSARPTRAAISISWRPGAKFPSRKFTSDQRAARLSPSPISANGAQKVGWA